MAAVLRSTVASYSVSGTGASDVVGDSCESSFAVSVPAVTNAGGDAGGMTKIAADHGKDFRLMYVRKLLAEAKEEMPECIINHSYKQLIGYVRGLLEQLGICMCRNCRRCVVASRYSLEQKSKKLIKLLMLFMYHYTPS